jgi:hypothetical protein
MFGVIPNFVFIYEAVCLTTVEIIKSNKIKLLVYNINMPSKIDSFFRG